MLLQMYSVYDKKAALFAPPFLSANDDTAKRDVQNLIARGGSIISDFPSDFDLFLIANFNDSSACVQPLDNPLFICSALALIEVEHK